MTVHMSQPSISACVEQVLHIVSQIDANGMSTIDRANTALSYVLDNSSDVWPMALQRQVLSQAVSALDGEAPSGLNAPVQAAAPAQATPPAQPNNNPVAKPVENNGSVPTFTSARDAGAEQPEGNTPRKAEMPKSAPTQAPPATTHEPKENAVTQTAPPVPSAPSDIGPDGTRPIMAVANDLMKALAEELDYADLSMRSRNEQEAKIKASIKKLGTAQKLHLNANELAELIDVVLSDLLGLGPLERLLADENVTDIMVNGPKKVFVERNGQLTLTTIQFRDNAHVMGVASRIVAAVGRRIDESQPMVDARLADGSRVNVAVPPLAIDGPTITIRKFPSNPVKLDRLIKGGSLSVKMGDFLALAANLRLNILVSGGTGSGKTTLMNAMSEHISPSERIITIEDAAELRFQQPHVVRFETRPPNVEGTGEVTMRTLMRNALRMRPDRIIIGEVRGDEVLDLLQAMNTGHDGSMSTLHANSPREALTRVESMAALAGFVPGAGVVRRQLVDAVNLVIQVSRMRDGKRRITSISEISGIAGDVITLQEIFTFQVAATSTRKQVEGEYVFSGYRPKFASRAADYGRLDDLNAILGGA